MGAPATNSQDNHPTGPCSDPPSPALADNGGPNPTPTDTPIPAGTGTVYVGFKSTGNLTNYQTVSDCLTIPLRSGGAINLRWRQIHGATSGWDAALVDGWTPGGRGGNFDFLPLVVGGYANTIKDSGVNRFYAQVGTAIGTTTYYEPADPLPYRLRRDSAAKTYREDNGRRRTITIIGDDPSSAANPESKPVSVTDANGNVVNFVYTARSAGNTSGGFALLRKLTGDVGNVVPYFSYGDESIPQAPIRKIYLYDRVNAANNRSVYFDYVQDASANWFLQKITYPNLCTKTYKLALIGGHPGIIMEQDADGYRTYFNYDAASNFHRIDEPLDAGRTRTTYYDFFPGIATRITKAGKPPAYYRYSNYASGNSVVPQLGSTQLADGTNVGHAWRGTNGQTTTHDKISYRVNAKGQKTYYEYNARNNLTKIVDNTLFATTGGANTSYVYAANGDDLHALIGPRHIAGSFPVVTYFNYDAKRNRISTVDALGRFWQNPRDALGRVHKRISGAGNSTYFNYETATGFLHSVVNPLANETYFGYDSFGVQARVVSPRWKAEGAAESPFTSYYRYDQRNRLTRSLSPKGQATYYEYTSRGDIGALSNNRGLVVATSYNGARLPTKRIAESSAGVVLSATYFNYDQYGNLIKLTDPRGNDTTYTYNAINKLASTTTASGTSWQYLDAMGRLDHVRDALNHTTYFLWDSQSGDPDGVLMHINRPLTTTVLYFDRARNVRKLQDEYIQYSYFVYDALDRMVQGVDSVGNVTSRGFDADGNVYKAQNGLGKSAYFAYDGVGRIVRIIDAINRQTNVAYDAAGNQRKIIDALNRTTYFVFDSADRLVRTVDPVQQQVQAAYDVADNRVKEVNALNHTSYFTYDQMNRVTTITSPLNRQSQYVYDASSNLVKIVNPAGQPLYFAYDQLNRRVQSFRDFGTAGYGTQPYGTSPYGGSEFITFGYDAVGNMTSMLDGTGSSTYKYDAQNRLRYKHTGGGLGAYFSYLGDSDLGMVLSTADGAQYNYWASVPGRPAGVSFIAGSRNFAYDKATRIVKWGGGNNNNSSYFVYDDAGQSSRICHMYGSPTPSVITDCQYQRDAAGRVARVLRETSANVAVYYNYDNADRLTAERWVRVSTGIQVYGFSYVYAANGNRLKQRREGDSGSLLDATYFVYDADDQLSKRNIQPSNSTAYYQYDLNGSVVKVVEGAKATYFEYDPRNFITQITPPASDGLPWQFSYDGQLNRVRIVRGSTTSQFLWKDEQMLEERDGGGALIARYIHGPSLTRGIGSVVAVNRVDSTGAVQFQGLHVDHRGTVIAVAAGSNPTTVYTVDAFGREIAPPHPLTGTTLSPLANDFVYQADWLTVTIGVKRYCLSPSRVYDPDLGRFLQRDPLPGLVKIISSGVVSGRGLYDYTIFDRLLLAQIFAQLFGQVMSDLTGKNLYIYASSNPTNRLDALGLIDGWDILGFGLDLAEGSLQTASGVADALSFGISTKVSNAIASGVFGQEGTDAINRAKCSGTFKVGQVAGTAVSVGRLGYAAAAKTAALLAKGATVGERAFAAASMRNALKQAFRAGAFQDYKIAQWDALVKKYKDFQAIIDAAGRTNKGLNVAGAAGALYGALGYDENECPCP